MIMVSEEFKENVELGDVVMVRSALVDYLIIDRTFKTFNDALVFASSRLPVVEEHDGREFEQNSNVWDERYLNVQKAALRYNFSQERINHLKEVIAAVMPPETVMDASGDAPAERRMSGGRTGRSVVEETILPSGTVAPTAGRPSVIRREPSRTGVPKVTHGKTGKRIVSETELPSGDDQGQKTSQGIDVSSALIVGGVAAAAVGVVVTEPVVIGAGIAAAGAGCIMKAANSK